MTEKGLLIAAYLLQHRRNSIDVVCVIIANGKEHIAIHQCTVLQKGLG